MSAQDLNRGLKESVSHSSETNSAFLEPLTDLVGSVTCALTDLQKADGHWIFELEADCTIPAEYILLGHFLDERDLATEGKLAAYIRDRQGVHGGWPLFHDGDFDISCSVKCYYALKAVGDSTEAPHMVRARNAILAAGGAAKSNVFTRILLALFGQVPWRAVPTMPVEIMFLPKWFPFHLTKVSYWSRTVIVPLLILMHYRPQAQNPLGIAVPELFVTAPEKESNYFANRGPVERGFRVIDSILRSVRPFVPRFVERRAVEKAAAWTLARLNGEDGLGGIFPAMANALIMFDILGYPRNHKDRLTCRKAIDKLLVLGDHSGYCQPCLSPVWDTGLALHALMESSGEDSQTITKACDWLASKQITSGPSDWADTRPGLAPGGWAFEYENPYYPDVDDTALVIMAMHRADPNKYESSISRGIAWIEGMQSTNGGWGAFDADNDRDYLNHIPFADHGALLDPPTADVTARCVGALCQTGRTLDDPTVKHGIDYLLKEQEDDGSWFGRWGTNYVYGTWSVLSALNAAKWPIDSPEIKKAVAWLKARQRHDGGWGEDGATYWDEHRDLEKVSTASQTAWAVLGLIAAGEHDCEAARDGVLFLMNAQRDGCEWDEPSYTAVGFPRVFYLRYHGYSNYFPLWALARYRNCQTGNSQTPLYGI